jgi:Tol biopolymer transport system component
MALLPACQDIPETAIGPTAPIASRNRIAYVGLSEDIRFSLFMVGQDGSNPFPLVEQGSDFQDPEFAPDGRSLVLTSNRMGNWDIHLIDLETLSLTSLAAGLFTDVQPSFSPDGNRIAFQRQTGTDLDWDIFVMNVDGTEIRNLTNSVGPDRRPTWSPDGSRIAYQSGERLDQEIWVIDSDGENRSQLTPSRPGMSGSPTWSPDGAFVLFESSEHQGDVSPTIQILYDLYVVSADGSGLRRLTEFSSPNRSVRFPAWAPSGIRIVFEVSESDQTFGASRFRIWKLDTETGVVKQLETPGTARTPVWSPVSDA